MEGPTFFVKVWELTKQIPKGKVTTYGDIAHALGTKAYRAVGTALNKNPYAPGVPCHRVVASGGNIGGFAYGLKRKKELLAREGVSVQGGRVLRFEQVHHQF